MTTVPRVMRESLAGTLWNYVIAGTLVLTIAIAFMLAEPRTVHWFILPAMACGILTGADLVRWCRGSLDPFDPKGLMGLTVFYGFFIAPLLHVYWQTYGMSLYFPGDPQPWLGMAMAANAVGLICFKLTQRWSFRRTAPVHSHWQLAPHRILPLLIVVVVIGVLAQAHFYTVFLKAARQADHEKALKMLQGHGWLLLLGDSLPALLLVGLVSWTQTPQRNRNWFIIALVLLLLAVTQFIWTGLRGSRSAFLILMFIAVCLIHFCWRRVRAPHLLLGLAFVVPFLYFYGFYKSAGTRGLKALDSAADRARLERKTGRTFRGMLLGDLAKADVQARIANEIVERQNDYQLRYGLTYVEALAKLVPYTVWEALLGDLSFKDRWTKAFAFWELNEGRATIIGKFPKSSRIYGLTGEAMLNFGFLGVPPVWLLYGLGMGWVRRKLYTLPPGDTRWVLMPLLILLTMGMAGNDLDCAIFALFKGGTVLFLCVFFWSSRSKSKTIP